MQLKYHPKLNGLKLIAPLVVDPNPAYSSTFLINAPEERGVLWISEVWNLNYKCYQIIFLMKIDQKLYITHIKSPEKT